MSNPLSGFLLHRIYHQPNGWDHKPEAVKAARGESSMWGDYHLVELGVYLQRRIEKQVLPKLLHAQLRQLRAGIFNRLQRSAEAHVQIDLLTAHLNCG